MTVYDVRDAAVWLMGEQAESDSWDDEDPVISDGPGAVALWRLQHLQPSTSRAATTLQVDRPTTNMAGPSHKPSAPAHIKTLMYFDLETTGLPGEPNPRLSPPADRDEATRVLGDLIRETKDYPRIVEAAFSEVPRSVFQRVANLMRTRYQKDEKKPPHIAVNSMVRQFNPSMAAQEEEQYEINRFRPETKGLFKIPATDLGTKRSLLSEWQHFFSFLSSTPAPRVLLAHNAAKFDLRVLHGELKRIGWKGPMFPAETFWLDTIYAFQKIDAGFDMEINGAISQVDWTRVLPPNSGNTTPSREEPDTTAGRQLAGRDIGRRPTKRILDAPLEITPEKRQFPDNAQTSVAAPDVPPRSSLESDKEQHPVAFLKQNSWSPAKRTRIAKDAIVKTSTGDWRFDFEAATAARRRNGTYRLSAMHGQLFQSEHPYQFHTALDDTQALIEICLAYGHEFLEYVDRMAAPLPASFFE